MRSSDGSAKVKLDSINKNRLSTAEDILRIAQSGDRACFVRLFMDFAPRVKAYLRHQGLSAEAAEDLAQETLINVWRKAGSFDPSKASASAWIFTIARNLRIDAFRRERHPSLLAEGLETSQSELKTPEEVCVGRESERDIEKALRMLPEEQLEVLRMSFFMGRAHAEIAEELHLPLGTVKSRLRLAVAHLRSRVAGP